MEAIRTNQLFSALFLAGSIRRCLRKLSSLHGANCNYFGSTGQKAPKKLIYPDFILIVNRL